MKKIQRISRAIVAILVVLMLCTTAFAASASASASSDANPLYGRKDTNSWSGYPDGDGIDTIRVQNLQLSSVKDVVLLNADSEDYKLMTQGQSGSPLFAVDITITGESNENMIVSFYVGRDRAGETYTILHRAGQRQN